ncbi:hypothetical protein AGMMS49579_08390 [Spirochaetia bacterium]|nr:hypothetical protein AGMMS49579_08390 [Spirochaetia bacterium]
MLFGMIAVFSNDDGFSTMTEPGFFVPALQWTFMGTAQTAADGSFFQRYAPHLKIPGDNEIRMLLDRIEPQEMSSVFGGMLKELDGRGGLEQFRVLDLPRASGFLGTPGIGRE